MKRYNPSKFERKWQKYWEKEKIFKASDRSEKPKFYVLDMFPYPSAYGIHVGHMKGYTFSDVIAKKKMMEGKNVLHPMGWDAFGLPAENYAIKTGIHPKISTFKAIRNIKKQLISAGYGYDWEREINSCEENYYKWTQWFFLKLYEHNLAYKKKAPVNWCPNCKTVLANEQVIEGKCERCGTLVEKRYLKQWFFKITKYIDRLLKDLDKIDWPEKIKIMQKNWIGRSEGAEIDFRIVGQKSKISVFTTRADTLFGCTYIVIAPEHKIISRLKSQILNLKEVEKYIEKTKRKTEIVRTTEDKEKTGVELKGVKAINPVNNEEIPVFVADYVVMGYGTGAIMAVPAHDQRDFLFAKKHNLPIVEVIKSKNGKSSIKSRAFEEDGILVNSGRFSGMSSDKARKEIVRWLKEKGLAKFSVQHKLRDWLVSRQRYWGAPIPVVYCPRCGEVPVPEKELPVKLPNIKDFKPTGDGRSPLAKSEKFVNCRCPKCNGPAKRETDTLDTFVCSSWYYLRYTDPSNQKEFASKRKIKKWLPVDLYIGGAEHAVMHLLYARFFAKFMKDIGLIDFDEPFLKLFNQGIIYYKGAKMSKSKGNVINPDEFIKKYGADTLRVYELFMGPADQATEWSDRGVIGIYRFLQRIWKLQYKIDAQKSSKSRDKVLDTALDKLILDKLIHKTIRKVTEDIDNFRFNTAISSLMILANEFEKQKYLTSDTYSTFLKLLAPFAPHLAEELWQKLGHKKSIFKEKWLKYDSKLVKEDTFVLIIQVNGKVRDKVEAPIGMNKSEAEKIALRREKVRKRIERDKIKKIIYVPDKLINIVV